jgi:DNA-binding helix-hairpin-helix protein with protein kinase domain
MMLSLHARYSGGVRRAIRIDPQDPLGSGGEGSVHAVLHAPHSVVKMFARPDAQRQAKIAAMIATPPAGGTGRRARLAWPEALVTDTTGRFLGFLMPRVDMRRCHPLDWHLLATQRKALGLRGDSATDYGFRLAIARNLAAVLAGVHAAGHALVDLKPPNILVDRDHGTVTIVDCDGACIAGQDRIHPAVVATEEYLAPEFHGRVRDADGRQDRFALAMIVFRLLNDGLYPMNGTPLDPEAPASNVGRIKAGLLTVNPAARMVPHARSIQHHLADETLHLLRRGLSASAILRPTPGDWQAHLEWLLRLARPCRSGRHVALPKGCPWCGEAPVRSMPPARPPAAVDAVLLAAAQPQARPPRAEPRIGRVARVGFAAVSILILMAALGAIAAPPGERGMADPLTERFAGGRPTSTAGMAALGMAPP